MQLKTQEEIVEKLQKEIGEYRKNDQLVEEYSKVRFPFS